MAVKLHLGCGREKGDVSMTRRQKLAWILRKWADLIDPRHDPSDGVSIRVTADTSEAEAAINGLYAKVEKLKHLPGYLAVTELTPGRWEFGPINRKRK